MALAALCPGVAAALVCAVTSGLQTALFVGLAAGAAGAVVALVADTGRSRELSANAAEASARARASQEERDAAAYEERVLAAALEGIADGVWITDVSGAVVRHNAALRRLLDAGEEVVGKRPLFLVRKGELHEAVLRACEAGTSSVVQVVMEGPRPRVLEVDVAGGERARALRVRGHPPQHGLHPEDELAHAEGFHHEVVGPLLQALAAVLLLAFGRHHHHRRAAQVGVLLHQPQHLAAWQVRKHQVEQHQFRLKRLGLGQGRRGGVGDFRLEASGSQIVGEQVGQVLLVLDDENP